MKKLFCILSILFIASTVQAQERDRFYTINDFSKGQNSHISEFNLPANQNPELLNVRINREYSALDKRDTMLTYLDFGSTAINSIHRYYKSDGTQETIVATSTLLRIYNSGVATTIQTGLSDAKRWQFVNYKDIAIGGNDANQPIKYDGKTSFTANTDGHRSTGLGCAQLGAPFAELDTGTDLDASSWYQYKMAWYDGSTYDYSTARSNPILTGAAVYNIALTDIPLGPTGTTIRYIYRTLGNVSQTAVEADTTFYLVGTISDNTTTTLADSVTDATADDDAAPTWTTASGGTNATPPICPILTIHNERLFMGGHATYPSELYFSDQYLPDHFLPTDFEEVRQDDGDKITGLPVLLGVLTPIKTNTIQKYYTLGSTTSDWSLSSPYSFIGSPAPYSIKPAPIGIIYLGRHGLYSFDGQKTSLISDAVTDIINDISQIDIETAAGHYHDNEYQLAYTSTLTGATANDRVLVYDIIRDAYVVDTKNINCFSSFNSGTDLGVLYSGSSTTDGYTFAHKGEDAVLAKRYESDFDAGTHDDTRTYGTETAPILEIAWDCTIDGWLTELQTKDANIDTINEIVTYLPAAIIDRPDTSGTWTSPVYYIQASTLDKLYWNENLGSTGDVDFYIRSAATSAAVGSATWSSAFSNPTGSDISGETANNYLQIKTTLTTSDIDFTPYLYSANGYVFKLTYSKIGTVYETAINSKARTGWHNFGLERIPKLIQDMKIYYTGTSGTLNLNIKDFKGNIDRDVSIDLSVSPTDDTEDDYEGTVDEKVYIYRPDVEADALKAEWFMFELTEPGIIGWKIKRVVIRYLAEEIAD